MTRHWSTEDILSLGRAFQPACVLAAAAELGLFDALAAGPQSAAVVAKALHADLRGTTILLDALAVLELVAKHDGLYSAAPGVADALTEGAGQSVLAMTRHQAVCLRRWAQLAAVVRSGQRASREPSVRGAAGDLEAFIEAMNEISRRMAPGLVSALGPPAFRRLLDIGGGPATWTIAFLRADKNTRATLFDLPEVLPLARKHLTEAGLTDRVELVGGDMLAGAPLPAGADLAWVSAIIHMNSREENRLLYTKVHQALAGGGRILVRDVVMDDAHTAPSDGAMFAVNMLVNTPGGGTYSLREICEDLTAAGFADAKLLHPGQFMDSVVQAVKP